MTTYFCFYLQGECAPGYTLKKKLLVFLVWHVDEMFIFLIISLMQNAQFQQSNKQDLFGMITVFLHVRIEEQPICAIRTVKYLLAHFHFLLEYTHF